MPDSVTLNACTACKKARAKVATIPLPPPFFNRSFSAPQTLQHRCRPLQSQGTDRCSPSAMEGSPRAGGVSFATCQTAVFMRFISRRPRRT